MLQAICFFNLFVLEEGFEPSNPAVLAPEASVSASSTTPALLYVVKKNSRGK